MEIKNKKIHYSSQIPNRFLESLAGIDYPIDSSFTLLPGVFKALNEDFIVHEILPDGCTVLGKTLYPRVSRQEGLFTHFILKKTGMDTISAIQHIAKRVNLSSSEFGIAGLKDATAITFQRISLWNPQKISIVDMKIPKIEISAAHSEKYKIQLGELWGNHFIIKIRLIRPMSLTNNDHELVLEKLQSNKIPNFFGLQRFGTSRPVLQEVGRALIQNRYEEAVAIYLLSTSAKERNYISKLRESLSFSKNFKEFHNKTPKKYDYERILSKSLINNPRNCKKAIMKLPREFLSLTISAFQSQMFNRLLSELLKDNSTDIPKDLPIIGHNTKINSYSQNIRNIISRQMDEFNLKISTFKHQIPILSARGAKRTSFVSLRNPCISFEDSKNSSIKLSFELAKGNYATMILREILEPSTKKLTNLKIKNHFEH